MAALDAAIVAAVRIAVPVEGNLAVPVDGFFFLSLHFFPIAGVSLATGFERGGTPTVPGAVAFES